MTQATTSRYRMDEEFIGAEDYLRDDGPYADWRRPTTQEIGMLVSAVKLEGVTHVWIRGEGAPTLPKPYSCKADAIIADLESRGLGWDICHAPFHFIEVRIWQWPVVIARHRPAATQPLAVMLTEALEGIDLNNNYPIKTWSSE